MEMFSPVVTVFAPLFLFMLIPVWIPLLAVACGALADRYDALRGRVAEPSPVDRLRARRAQELPTYM